MTDPTPLDLDEPVPTRADWAQFIGSRISDAQWHEFQHAWYRERYPALVAALRDAQAEVAEARRDLDASIASAKAEVERLRKENHGLQGAVSRAENRWRAASEVDAAQALLACVSGSYEYGVQDNEFVAAYVIPTGPIHRAIVVLWALGIVVRPRPQEVMPPALAERINAERDTARAQVAAVLADLRALCDGVMPSSAYTLAAEIRALLDRHTPEETT